MLSVEARINQGQLKLLLQRVNLVDKMVHYYIETPGQLPKKLALRYIENLRSFIMFQRGMVSYQKYNPRYAEWKSEVSKGGGFWKLFGDLFTALSVLNRGKGEWLAGVSGGTVDRGGKSWFGKGNQGSSKSIAMYGSVMEEGLKTSINHSGVHPARPLFLPVLKDFAYSKSKSSQGGAWDLADKMLSIIGDYWSYGINRRTL